MDEKHETTQNIGVPANTAAATIPPPENATPASQPATAQQLTNAQTNIETRMSSFERATLRWTRAMFVVTSATALFICFQWIEMRSSSTQTDKLIAAQERIAKAMEDTYAKSKEALDASIAASRTDQRAWVGMTDITINSAVVGSPFSYTVWFGNSGRTPALKTHFLATSKAVYKKETPNFTYDSSPMPPSGEITMQPGVRLSIGGTPAQLGTALTAAQVDALKRQVTVMYIYGRVEYQDIFTGTAKHHTRFCAYLEPDLKSVHPCDRHNDAD